MRLPAPTLFIGFAWLICVALFCVHFYLISRYAVDVPYQDEWGSFEADQLPSGLSVRTLSVQNNEHRIATTRLLIWLLYHVNGWNLAIHQDINFVLYGLTLLLLAWLLMSDGSQHTGFVVLSFTIFLLSPINRVNHFWGYQSQLHFWLLFLVLACYFLFREAENWFDLVVGALAAILCMYSMAGGVVASLVLIVMFTLFKINGIRAKRSASPYLSSFLPAIFILAVLGTASLFWLSDYGRPSYHPALVLPYKWRFWKHFLNIVAFGFGIDQVSTKIGVFYLILVLLPILGLVCHYGRNLPISSWRRITLTLAVLAVLASVSAGRAGMGTEHSKESRYFELAMPLLPLSIVNWTVFLQDKKRWRTAALVILWIICCLAFGDNWRQFRFYKREAVKRQMGIACLQAYYEGRGDSNCPTLYPVPLPTRLLEQAKNLNVSFYRRISNNTQY